MKKVLLIAVNEGFSFQGKSSEKFHSSYEQFFDVKRVSLTAVNKGFSSQGKNNEKLCSSQEKLFDVKGVFLIAVNDAQTPGVSPEDARELTKVVRDVAARLKRSERAEPQLSKNVGVAVTEPFHAVACSARSLAIVPRRV